MREPRWVRVEFSGHGTFWVQPAALRGADHSPLAPEHHIRDGDLAFPECFDGDSYAHLFEDGTIKRYHAKIGEVSELRVLASPPSDTERGGE